MALTQYREKFSAFTGSARTRETAMAAVTSLEVFGGALALGWYEGKMGSAKMYLGADDTKPVGESGVPVALLVGFAGLAGGLASFGTGYSKHIRAVGDAGFAVYGNHLGKKMGKKSADDVAAADPSKPAPEVVIGAPGYDRYFAPALNVSPALAAALTPAQLATVQRVARAGR